MFNLDECVAFVTNLASKTLSESLNNRLMIYNVTKSQWIAMYYIEKNESLSQKDLADLMGASQPTVTGILDRLEKQGYIERREDKEDKRRKVIGLTKEGRKINKKLTDIGEDFRNACLEDVSVKDQEIFLDILDKMVKSCKKWDEDTKRISDEKLM